MSPSTANLRRSDGEDAVSRRCGHGLVRLILGVTSVVAVVMAGVVVFPISRASASPIVAPALPSWFADLGTGRPEPDQLQDRLDAALTTFLSHGGWDKAIADGCVDVIGASHVARAARTAVDKAWTNVNDAFNGLTATEVTAAALIATRAADLLAKIVAFQIKMAAAAVGEAPALAHSLSSFTSAVSKAAVDVYEGVVHGNADAAKNAQDAITLALKIFKGSASTLGTVFLDGVSQGQSVLAIVNDVRQLRQDSSAATNAYFEAGNLYSAQLNAYQKAMTKLSLQVRTNCPPKTTTTTKPKPTTTKPKPTNMTTKPKPTTTKPKPADCTTTKPNPAGLPPWSSTAVGAWSVRDACQALEMYCDPGGVVSNFNPGSPLCGKSPVDWEKVCSPPVSLASGWHAYAYVFSHDDPDDPGDRYHHDRYPSGIVCVKKLL
jgi:hypothetical protein